MSVAHIARRLTTILAADIAGFSKAAERDEANALENATTRLAILVHEIQREDGRVFKRTGDGLLAEFPSAAAGVRAGLAAQHLLANQTGFQIRIGIHLGDVSPARDGDLMGHAVNIAARLEQACEPGLVLASAAVWEQARGQVDANSVALGRERLAKMATATRVFEISPSTTRRTGILRRALRRTRSFLFSKPRLVLVSLVAVVGVGAVIALKTPPPTPPRLAVLRFATSGATAPYFAEGVADELGAEASHIQGLEVVARASSFALTGVDATPAAANTQLGATLVLSGSVSHLQNTTRVIAQLAAAPSGRQVWSDTFERPDSELFDLQREIAVRVAQAAGLRTVQKPAQRVDPAALDAYMQARELMSSPNLENVNASRALLQSAVERAPNFASAYYWLGQATFQSAVMQWHEVGHDDAPFDLGAITAADSDYDRALALNPRDPDPYGAKAALAVFFRNDWNAAAHFDALARAHGGHTSSTLRALGRLREAIDQSRQRIVLNPLDVAEWEPHSANCWIAGNYACSLDAYNHILTLIPASTATRQQLFIRLVAAGQLAQARALVAAHRDMIEHGVDSFDRAYVAWKLGTGPRPSAHEALAEYAAGRRSPAHAVDELIDYGDFDDAGRILGAFNGRSYAAMDMVMKLYQPRAAPLRARPEFWRFVDRIGLLGYWRHSGAWPDFCRTETCPR